ncbi:MAG: hypothetical protein IJD30_05365 [Clostridia bacterium]|nr:hypothetical protein [Clostridia bacterium]
MIKVNGYDIEYTYGDTFSINVTPKKDTIFETGMQLRFVIAETEQSESIIDKTIAIGEDLIFTVTLNDTEKKLLPQGQYQYKMVIYQNNTIITVSDGDFIVKWGA